MRVLRSFAVLASLGLALSARPARACAVCSSGDPAITLLGTEKPFAGRLRIDLDLRLGGARAGLPGRDEISVAERRLDLTVAYAPIPDLFLAAGAPLLFRTAVDSRGASSSALVPGDVELRAQGFVWHAYRGPFRHRLAIQGGVKLPTGPTEEGPSSAPLPAVLQPGMGSIAPFLGFFYAVARGPWSFGSSAAYALPLAVRTGPHAADSFRTSASLQRQAGLAFAGRFEIDTRFEQSADADKNSGGFVAYVSPGLTLRPTTDLLLSVGARVPVLQALHGQHRELSIWELGVTWDR